MNNRLVDLINNHYLLLKEIGDLNSFEAAFSKLDADGNGKLCENEVSKKKSD